MKIKLHLSSLFAFKYKPTPYNEKNKALFSHSDNGRLTTICCMIMLTKRSKSQLSFSLIAKPNSQARCENFHPIKTY
jgi:hypothetical protein